jgi:hypothetical protein
VTLVLDGAEADAARCACTELNKALFRSHVPGRQPVQQLLPPILLLLQPPALSCVALQRGKLSSDVQAQQLHISTSAASCHTWLLPCSGSLDVVVVPLLLKGKRLSV